MFSIVVDCTPAPSEMIVTLMAAHGDITPMPDAASAAFRLTW